MSDLYNCLINIYTNKFFKPAIIALFLVMFVYYIYSNIKENYVIVDEKKQFLAKEFMKQMIVLFIPLFSIVVVCRFVFTFSVILSGSMEPTIQTGKVVIINRLAYINHEVERGDIIFFDSEENQAIFGKRVIGLPGEVIEFKNGDVFINGEYLDESAYIDDDVETYCFETFTVPESCYFVLGDNRAVSYDSRFWSDPFVKKDTIIGQYIKLFHSSSSSSYSRVHENSHSMPLY